MGKDNKWVVEFRIKIIYNLNASICSRPYQCAGTFKGRLMVLFYDLLHILHDK